MKKIILLIFTISSFAVSSQEVKKVYVKHIQQPITIDGELNEAEWSQTKSATNFWQYFPTDTLQAKQQAEIKMLFDEQTLYIGMKVNSSSNKYIVPSLRRDFRASGNDNITMLFDTFNDGSNAYFFGTNPAGVKREALLSGGGTDLRGFNMAWDTKWVSETKIHDNYYIVEMAIPLSAFKYREGETKWRFNSYHFDTQDNERNTWINIPQNQWIFNLAYMGDMIFEKPLGKSKAPIAIIPYINTFTAKDYENNTTTNDFKIGGDAKFAIGNSMNLDVTFNPDFSQIEVDQQITNLTRFEISLPERRQFFVENSDLFGDFGNSRDGNPFFSRRIGIAKDINGNSIENGIVAGVRLSGKIN
ncbi:MAG: carbohydrate binding family 9 domain-containing protein, partial [Flavobacteriaceae bacterium]|nr:carbohydrate binding family 9 domain-containing protein [Flavobacteriaceae bacterium]